jgi:nucleoside-diphosphate kinase
MERTLLLIKPEGVKRGLAGAIINRLEAAGLKIVGIKMLQPDVALAELHYPEGDHWKETWINTKKGYAERGLQYKETLCNLQTGLDLA